MMASPGATPIVVYLSVTMKTGGLWNDFEWTVEAGGYRWQEVRTGLLLVPNRIKSAPVKVRVYRPLTRPFADLHSRFANLDHSPAAVLGFANQFGVLGWPITSVTWRSDVSLVPATGPFDASDFVKTGDLRRSYPGQVGEYFAAPDGGKSDQTSWVAQIKHLSNFQTNRRLLRTVPALAASLQADVNLQLERTVGAFVSRPNDSAVFRLRLWPKSLLGALWLQAAQALSDKAEFRKCLECEAPIEISRSGARSDATFCSDSCKLRDYRKRKNQARKMAGRGILPKEIARKLRTTPATVRGWLR